MKAALRRVVTRNAKARYTVVSSFFYQILVDHLEGALDLKERNEMGVLLKSCYIKLKVARNV